MLAENNVDAMFESIFCNSTAFPCSVFGESLVFTCLECTVTLSIRVSEDTTKKNKSPN